MSFNKRFAFKDKTDAVLKPIPTTFVENLMVRYDLSGKLLTIKKLKKGDQVKVTKGPFANIIANIEKYESDHRISVLMDLMGRKTTIDIPANALQTFD